MGGTEPLLISTEFSRDNAVIITPLYNHKTIIINEF